MPVSEKTRRPRKPRTSKPKTGSKGMSLDILFAGPLLFVPAVKNGDVTSVEILSPRNGHHIGAVFLPGIFFSDAELDAPENERWPGPESFSLLDPHSYLISLTQKAGKQRPPFSVASIPGNNHKIRSGRRLTADWEVSVIVEGRLSGWSSYRVAKVTDGLFCGADSPASETVASLHRLSYVGVKAADIHGASAEPRAYLRSNISKGGTLIVMGEIPYQSTLRHERAAIDAIAKLAGLDLHLAETAPSPYRTRLMSHVTSCGHSIVVVPGED